MNVLSFRFQIQQLSASLSSDNHTQRVVNLFTQFSMSLQTPPAMHVYESLLNACARNYHLHWAMGVFNTVTGRHGVAPSRNVSPCDSYPRMSSGREMGVFKSLNIEECHDTLQGLTLQ